VDAGVWLHLGLDYDHDGKISPFGRPDDALATTARYFVERGNYRRGEPWGHEVRAPDKVGGKKSRRYAEWQKLGVARADGQAFPSPRRYCQALGPGAGRAGLSARAEFLRRAHLQSVDELHAGDCASRRPLHRRRGFLCRAFLAASARRRSPKCRKFSAA
jgi:Membrane-bound lytic murein transglycosylase B